MANKTQENRSSIWKERFENRKQKLTPMFEAAQKYYDIMYAVQSTTKVSPWKSKVYVPILASKAWDLIARMSDVVPLYNVTIKNELEIDDATGSFVLPEVVKQREKRIEAKLHYDYNSCHQEPMKLKVFDPLVDAVVAGTGYAYAPWVAETKKSKARSFDEMGTMDNENTVTKKTETGHNGFEGVNFFNVFPADASSYFQAPYLIVRGYKPKVDMELAGVYDQGALDRCDTGADDYQEFKLFNESRNRVVNESDSFQVDESVDMITYYECYERTKDGIELTTFAEGEKVEGEDSGWVEIRKKSIPYWHDFFPVVPFYCRKKSYSVFGESLFENNRTLQSATNDLFNHYLDNWNLSIESMLMYEDGTLTNDFIIEPGGEITYTGEAPKQFKFPEPNPQQLSLVMSVLEKGVENATFSQYASGVPNSSADKTQGTAYGVKTISEAATTKIGFFRDNFKQSMKVVGQIWLSNLQQFSDDPAEVRRVVDGKTVPDVVMPSDYQGEVELDIDDDSMTPISKQDKRDMNTQFTQDILALQDAAMKQMQVFGDPTDVPRFNFIELAQEKAQLYSLKDFERMLLDNKVAPPPPPTADQPKDPKELLNFSYKDAPPDVQAQIEKMYGFTPSAIHHSALANTAANHGADLGRLINEGQGENPDGTPVNQPIGQPGAATSAPAGSPA